MGRYFICSVVLGLSFFQPASAQRESSPPLSQANKDLEVRKLELEQKRLDEDVRLREQELQLRREELKAKQQGDQKQWINSFTGVSGPILLGMAGLLVTWFVNKRQTQANYETQLHLERQKYQTQRELDKQKFQAELISKMIETGNQAASAENLLFLIDGGLIDDPGNKIRKLADQGKVAVLSARSYVSGAYRGIPPEGVGGRDPELNLLKNRDLPPKGGKYESMTIADMIALRPARADETLDKSRRDWSTEARNEIGAWENKGVQVEGYIRRATIQGPSAAYAMKRGLEFSPVHLYLVSEPEQGPEKSLTAVVTPRVSQRYPHWTLSRLRELGEQKARVRISGWLIWEQFQAKKVGNIAGTLWRITPVLKIEMQKGKHWVALSGEVLDSL
jgi:hypothetical protein